MMILDVRTPQEYADWHLDGAINVPISAPVTPEGRHTMNVFIARLNRFSRRRSRPFVIYCKLGIRSTVMEDMLLQAGFYNLINLGGVQTMPLIKMRQQNQTKL
jgi:phage shock protein E